MARLTIKEKLQFEMFPKSLYSKQRVLMMLSQGTQVAQVKPFTMLP